MISGSDFSSRLLPTLKINFYPAESDKSILEDEAKLASTYRILMIQKPIQCKLQREFNASGGKTLGLIQFLPRLPLF